MANMYINDMSEVWTSIGTSYSAIKMNVTNAASMTTPTISKLLHLQVGGSDKFTVDKNGGVVAANTVTAAGVISATAPVPVSHDGAALGSAAAAWSDLFLASGGVINWNNGDVTVTHAAEALFFAGAGSGYSFDGAVQPTLADAAALGSSVLQWSDLFLASGGVINWANGDITFTHTGNVLTVDGGDLRVTTAGTNAASAVTVGGTQTLTNKTISGGTISGAVGFATTDNYITIGPATSGSGGGIARTITSGFTAIYGGTSGSTGAYMHLYGETHASNARDIVLGTEGSYRYFYDYSTGIHNWSNNTPTNIMNLNASGDLQVDRHITSSTGNLTVAGAATIGGNIHGSTVYADAAYFVGGGSAAVLAAPGAGGTIYLRPNGPTSIVEQVYVNSNGTLVIDPTTTGILINKPTGTTSNAIIGYGNISSGGVRGYCNNTDYYGILGFQSAGVAYSFYGSGQAHNSTSWDVSDARAKSNIADYDCHDAYAKVRAIGVKSYRKATIDEVGWLAQEIELVIPEAVMDVGIPEDDTATRNMVGGDTIKATNDRTMLATLWAAFQHQTHLIEALEAKLTALEAKGN